MDIEFKLNREREEDQMGLMHWERIEVLKKTIVEEVDKGSLVCKTVAKLAEETRASCPLEMT